MRMPVVISDTDVICWSSSSKNAISVYKANCDENTLHGDDKQFFEVLAYKCSYSIEVWHESSVLMHNMIHE